MNRRRRARGPDPVRRIASVTAMLAAAAIGTAACSGETGGDEGGGTASSCEQAVRAAAEVGPGARSPADIDPAITTCATFGEFAAATDRHPEAIGGADAATVADNRCRFSDDPAVRASAICAEIAP